MHFLLDANVPYSAKECFEDEHEVTHVRECGLADATDEIISTWAQHHHAVLITRDFDFANILNFPPHEYSGIVVLKMPYTYRVEQIKRLLKNFLQAANLSKLTKTLVIVEEGRYRVKR